MDDEHNNEISDKKGGDIEMVIVNVDVIKDNRTSSKYVSRGGSQRTWEIRIEDYKNKWGEVCGVECLELQRGQEI